MEQQPYLYFRATISSNRSVIVSGYQPFVGLQEETAWAISEVRKELAEGEQIVHLDRYIFGNGDDLGHWDEITTAFRLGRFRTVLIDDVPATFGSWKGNGDGTATFIDTRRKPQGSFPKHHAFVLKSDLAARQRFAAYEKAEQEARDRAEQEAAEADAAAEMAGERAREDAGFWEARGQEDYEASLGIER